MQRKLLLLFLIMSVQLSVAQTYPHVYSASAAGTASANPNFTITDLSTCQTSVSLDANGYNYGGNTAVTYAIEVNGATILTNQYGAQTIDLTPYIPVTSVKLRSSSSSSWWLDIGATVTINSPLASMPVSGPSVTDVQLCSTDLPYNVNATLTAGNTTLKWYNNEQGGVPNFTAPTVNAFGDNIYWVSQADASGCESERVPITISVSSPISATSIVTDVACNGGNTGSIDVTPTGGFAPYTYDWGGGIITEDRNNLTIGTYSVIITDDNGCTGTVNFTINEPTAITATASTTQVDVLCNGAATGSATIDVTGGVSPYTYAWSDGQTTATATGLTAGTYTVDVTDDNSCVYTHSFTINEPTAITATASTTQVDVLCNGAATGSATIDVTGGTGSYSYLWDTGAITPTITGLTAGTYSVDVTDASNCVYTHNFTITEPAAITATASTTQVDVLCNGAATGEATIAVTGGTGSYTYLWDDINAQTTATATGLTAGTYSVVVTDANVPGCTYTHSFTITEPTPITATAGTTQVDVLCNGAATGEATIAVTGGTGTYTYLWDDINAQTSATATGLTAGTYSVVVTDANVPGCTYTHNFTITEPAAITATASTTQVDVLCNGAATGEATIVVTGGTGSYTYLWDTGATTPTISGLTAGTYSVVVTDANVPGCTYTHNFTINEPTAITATASQIDVLCNGAATGEASIVVSGGVGPYSYVWSDGQITDTATGLTAGNYDVTVTDNNGCTYNESFTINEPAALSAIPSQINVLCNGAATGEASVNVSGGVASYTYLWSDGQTTATATGLAAGNYSVNITDAYGCMLTQNFTISEPSPLAVAPGTMQTNVLCNGTATGTATIVVMGGVTPYTYLWSNGQTTATATGLSQGTYGVIVTDGNNCTLTQMFTITEPTALTVVPSQINILCNGNSTGEASISVSGGVSPYTYLWNTGSIANTITNIPAGNYSVVVTDNNGCSFTQNFTITEPAPLAATPSQVDILCNGAATGEASVAVSGGVGTYTYLWSEGQTTATATGLNAGNYDVTVTDINGCTLTQSFTLTEPDAITATPNTNQVNVLCNGAATGEATIAVMGGVAPYTYSWNDGQTAATATGLTAGLYTVEVTDDNGCIFTYDFTITEPSALAIIPTQTDVLCNGASTGAASVGVSGGVGPYTYEWSNGEITDAISDIPAGDYDVTVTDVNGCILIQNFTINEPEALSVVASQVDILCNGAATGEATVTVSGGVAPYTYLWSDGQITATATGLTAGAYSVTVTDVNNCTFVQEFNFSEPDAITATPNTNQVDVLCNGAATGEATIVVEGGVAPYTYLWSDGQTAATATGLTAGLYTVTVTDDNGCVFNYDFTINEPEALTITPSQTDILCNGASTGAASVVVSGGVGPYIYVWSNGESTDAISDIPAGDYNVTVTDANGCTIIQDFTIEEPTLLTATTDGVNITCFNAANGSATVVASGGVTPYTYSWSNGEITDTISDLTPGDYTATVTDANGCTATSTIIITQPQVLTGYIAQTNVSCNGGGNGAATVYANAGTAPYTYLWSTGDTTQTIAGLSAGSYSVTITDANGCQLVRNATITQPSPLFLSAGQVNPTCVTANNGTAHVTAYGGTPPYTYLWSTGATTETISNLTAGSYTITVTDANGCISNSTVNIQGLPAASITTQPADELAVNDGNAHFVATVANASTYQWQESIDNGVTWNNVVNGGVNPTYMGAQTSTLVLVHIPLSHNGRLYRVLVNEVIGCSQITQPALLTVTNNIWATDDDFTDNPVFTGNGGIAGNILANDTFNDNPVTWDEVTVTIIDNGGLTGLSIDTDGNLIVPVGATPGTYVVVYQICNLDVTTSCDTAEVTIVVSSVLGVDDFTVIKPEIYPNPATTELFIKLPENAYTDGMNIIIYDLNGRLVKEQVITGQLTRLDIESLEAAEYILTIATEHGTVSQRIIKRR